MTKTSTESTKDSFSLSGNVLLRVTDKAGSVLAEEQTHNTTCVGAAYALAAAYAGDSSFMPSGVAFVTDPSVVSSAELTWNDVKDYSSVVGFSYRPTLDGNRVIFHAKTADIPDNATIYKACLIGRSTTGGEYAVLAVVDLGEKTKPADFDLSIDWTVTFGYGSSSSKIDDELLNS